MNPARAGVPPDAARDAGLAAALLAVDPAGLGGVVLRARVGPLRERWLAGLRALLPDAPWRTLPLHAPVGRLVGGLDLAASLATGRPVAERGLLAEAHGGVLLVAMAERVSAHTGATLAASLDTGRVCVERDGLAADHPARIALVVLDEGIGEAERAPAGLLDRLALHLDLDALETMPGASADPDAVARARRRLPLVADPPAICEALCAAAHTLGIDSLRAPLLALRVARAAAALDGRDAIDEADAALAARLVLAPRATRLPAAEPEAESPDASEPPEAPESEPAAEAQSETVSMEDVVLAAAAAAIPADLLARLRDAGEARAGRAPAGAGAERRSGLRGRPAGIRRGDPRRGGRLALVETLRAAAPWQRLRGAVPGDRVLVRADDLRVARYRERTRATTIFVVDASGSAALHRLAEAKGAVELVLAQCYVRRDRVALIVFRGRGAELLLPPTTSLVRAKRDLARLPGGGGTPLASGLDAARALGADLAARGETPLVVLLTDGRANIARDGGPGRPRAEADAAAAARAFAGAGIPGLVVDIAPLPGPRTRELAALMRARHLALPGADAAGLSRAVGAAQAS